MSEHAASSVGTVTDIGNGTKKVVSNWSQTAMRRKWDGSIKLTAKLSVSLECCFDGERICITLRNFNGAKQKQDPRHVIVIMQPMQLRCCQSVLCSFILHVP